METMKNEWGKPLTNVQQFVPQEFIAACDPDADYVTYELWCNASLTGPGGIEYGAYHLYYDNGDGVFSEYSDTSVMPSGWTFNPCNATHSVTVEKGKSIDDVFPKGWIVPLRGTDHAELTNRATACRIWKPRPNDHRNTHCTLQLNENEFHVHNPS